MVSQQEKTRLREAFKHEPLYVAALVFKCAACLIMIIGLALVGARSEPAANDAGQLQARTPEIRSLSPRPNERRALVDRAHSATEAPAVRSERARSPNGTIAFESVCGSSC